MPRCLPVPGTVSRCIRATSLLAVVGLVLAGSPLSAHGQDAPDTSGQSSPPSYNRFYAEMWTPRERTGEFHIHGGVFLPTGASATSPTVGMRIGLDLGPHVQLGVMGDYAFKRKSLRTPVDGALPGYEPNIVLAEIDAQLVPAMAFLQVKLTNKFFLVPYAGVGAGYEWLILNGRDFRTGETADATYSNWAWQSYGGVGIRLSKGVRFDSEVFYNGAMLGRDIVDLNGVTWRETVDASGVGVRVGLNAVY